MHLGQFLTQDQHLLCRQGLEADDRCQEVARAWPGKPAFGKAGPKRLITVDSPALVLHGLGRRPHEDPEVLCLALQGVVVHSQNLFVIVLARDRIRDLVDIDQLVDHDKHACVAGQAEKGREKLEVLVPVIIIDDDIDPQFLLCLSF